MRELLLCRPILPAAAVITASWCRTVDNSRGAHTLRGSRRKHQYPQQNEAVAVSTHGIHNDQQMGAEGSCKAACLGTTVALRSGYRKGLKRVAGSRNALLEAQMRCWMRFAVCCFDSKSGRFCCRKSNLLRPQQFFCCLMTGFCAGVAALNFSKQQIGLS
jgi:hypothetical protein